MKSKLIYNLTFLLFKLQLSLYLLS
uniref:Uncharacterized protein n=1 Tax=Anguilla anguilla TaxID=7936 RepID=A0A0E9V7X2_ANGAN